MQNIEQTAADLKRLNEKLDRAKHAAFKLLLLHCNGHQKKKSIARNIWDVLTVPLSLSEFKLKKMK